MEAVKTRPKLKYLRMTNQAFKPTKGSSKAAGLDLYAVGDTTIPAKSKGIVKTGLKVAIPTGHYGRITPRGAIR